MIGEYMAQAENLAAQLVPLLLVAADDPRGFVAEHVSRSARDDDEFALAVWILMAERL